MGGNEVIRERRTCRNRWRIPLKYTNAKLNSEELWGAIDAIGKENATADKIPPAIIAKLIELKFARLDKAGLPQLTAKGHRAYVVMESGDGEVLELDNYGGR